ncbi:MAG: mannitol-1-phosphate 5-dehydrogenase [Propionibacteriaceae bacterium]|nr:mannitol-1-phosphate 5-dehydrogenase [Micropruina sp.]HBX81288.1 mannitol-1-phosphate 5-dehydrogenase [Propionibacteriaceae bacterium]HBY21834.1 mannitol-1-phosphate 5-dehydrogenase [Propionibacteriaceae bacterium]
MKAVHFGAGNIGRGFVGLLLNQSGYDVTFVDVVDNLIDQLKATDSYVVHEVGDHPRTHVVRGHRAAHSIKEPEVVIAAIAEADVITTAVGVTILPRIAGLIAQGLAARPAGAPKAAVIACENAINGTDVLHAAVAENYPGDDLDAKAVFPNCAIDRIVPNQASDAGLAVTVENYFEWAVESKPFNGNLPPIEGVHWVDDLEPYIERKLFTVNTGHATAAYHGFAAGISKLSDALADPAIHAKVAAVLAETSALVVAKHGIDPEVQAAYVAKILVRFANPDLPDTTERVGRSPLRKLSRNDRFISPASQLAERGMGRAALVETVGAALLFNAQGDPEAAGMQEMLLAMSADEFVSTVTGLEPAHPLYGDIVSVVQAWQG